MPRSEENKSEAERKGWGKAKGIKRQNTETGKRNSKINTIRFQVQRFLSKASLSCEVKAEHIL